MVDVGETFVLLEASNKSVASDKILTASVGPTIDGVPVLAGLDGLGRKHLLVPVADDSIATDRGSQGVTLGARVLTIDGDDRLFADLQCAIPRLDLVFERLVSDVLVRLGTDSSKPVTTCRQTLDDWRSLLRSAGSTVDREVVLGLIGELEVLRRLAVNDGAGALAAWRGPSGAVHDFVRGGAAIEVKATASVEGSYVAIANLDQLDPTSVEDLHLVVIHVRPDETEPSLDDRIDQVVALGVTKEALLLRVAEAGYVYESDPQIPTTYAIKSVRGWVVGDGFPGLRASDLGEQRLKGVSNVKYELVLDATPPRLAEAELDALFVDWLAR